MAKGRRTLLDLVGPKLVQSMVGTNQHIKQELLVLFLHVAC